MMPDLSGLPLFICLCMAAAALIAGILGFGIGWLAFA